MFTLVGMKEDVREPSYEVIAVRVPTSLAREIKKAAREDDRTLSGYLRRVLALSVEHAETR